eukprot:635450-Amphidinium_carterae.1
MATGSVSQSSRFAGRFDTDEQCDDTCIFVEYSSLLHSSLVLRPYEPNTQASTPTAMPWTSSELVCLQGYKSNARIP